MKIFLAILAAVIALSVVYWSYTKTKLAGRKQFLTDFWFGSIGIHDVEAGLGIDECARECDKLCLGQRPNTNPLATTLFLPFSRLRIACHDRCEKDVCGKQPRLNENTICGHRTDGWSAITTIFPITYLTCLFD